MQSVFSTKDDVGCGGESVKLVVANGKLVWEKTPSMTSNESDITSSWIAEITSASSAEDEDTATSFTEIKNKLVDDVDDGGGSARDVDLVPNCRSTDADFSLDLGMDSHAEHINNRSVLGNGHYSSIKRMSLRQRSTPLPSTVKPRKTYRGASGNLWSKVICTRGRGGRVMRAFGVKELDGLWPKNEDPPECTNTNNGIFDYPSSTNDHNINNNKHSHEENPSLVIDGLSSSDCWLKSGELIPIMNSNDSCNFSSNDVQRPSVDSGIFNAGSLNGLESVTKTELSQTFNDKDEFSNGNIKRRRKRTTSGTDNASSLKRSPDLDANKMSRKLFCKRRKLDTSFGIETNTDEDPSQSPKSVCVTSNGPIKVNGVHKMVPTLQVRPKENDTCVSDADVTDVEKTLGIQRKQTSRRINSMKELEDLIDGSIKLAEVVALKRSENVISRDRRASLSPSPLPLVEESTVLPITASTLATVGKFSLKPAQASKAFIPMTRQEIAKHVLEDQPEILTLMEKPLLPEVPLHRPPTILVKALQKYSRNICSHSVQQSTMATTATNKLRVKKTKSKSKDALFTTRDKQNLKLEPLRDKIVIKGIQILNANRSSDDKIAVWPSSKFNEITVGELLPMPRATKCKAMQKISAMVTRKKKNKKGITGVEKGKRLDESSDMTDNVTDMETTPDLLCQALSKTRLPPPPRLIPCSISRTEELRRKNLQDKLLASALPLTPNHLECRVNIPQLERHPLIPKIFSRTPPLPVTEPAVSHLSPRISVPVAEDECVSDQRAVPAAASITNGDVEKRPMGRPRINRLPNVKATRFSRNGRRIGRPPIRSLADNGRDVPGSDGDVVAKPTNIVDRELRRLRLMAPAMASVNLPGLNGSTTTATTIAVPSSNASLGQQLVVVEQPQRSSVRQSECAFRYREIVLKKHDRFTQIVLTPSTRVKNGLNTKVLRELKMALDAARTDKNCHVVLLNGTGSVFCSGIDLISLVKDNDNTSTVKEMAIALRDFSKAVMSFPKTLVAAVNGAAVGFGVTMLPLFDMVYASDKATFYTPYVKLGQIPEGGATFSLPLTMGFARANGLLMGGRRITATEAFECGLVTQVLWPSAFMEWVIPQVQALAKQPLQTMGSAKALIRYHSTRELQVTLDIECRILAEQWSSPDCIQAIREFLDKEEVV